MDDDRRTDTPQSATGWPGWFASCRSSAPTPTACDRPRSPAGSDVRPDRLPRPDARSTRRSGSRSGPTSGRWGVVGDEGSCPPLKLTLAEAMAVVLSARLMVRYADKYDPDLAAAFEKLAGGPAPRRWRSTSNGRSTSSSQRPRDEAFSQRGPPADPGLGRAPRRRARLRAGPLRARRRAAAGRRPAVPHRAVAPDARAVPHRLGRDPRRAADLQDRAHPGCRAHAADLRAARAGTAEAGTIETTLQRAWDIIADQPPVDGRAALRAGRRRPGPRGDLASDASASSRSPTARCAGGRRSRAPSRSGCGSCPGAPTWRCSSLRPSARTWRRPWIGPSRHTADAVRAVRAGALRSRQI